MEIPETTKDITVEWLNQVLHKNGFLGAASVARFQLEAMGVGQGFASDMARLTLVLDGDNPNPPITMIAKLPPCDPVNREIIIKRNFFENEIRFYVEIAPNSPIRTPKLIYSEMDKGNQRYVILMEDCSYATPGDPHWEGLTYEQTKIVVLKIADFHARWWGAEDFLSTKGISKAKEWRRSDMERVLNAWHMAVQMPAFKSALPEGGWQSAVQLCDRWSSLINNLPEDRLTIVHNDLKSDNVFFDWRSPSDPLIVFDWGSAMIGCGVFDLSYLFSGSLASELRRRVEKEMVKAYHERLLQGGVSNYTLDECWSDYVRGLPMRAVQWLVTWVGAEPGDQRVKFAKMTLNRWFSAILDNNATSILP